MNLIKWCILIRWLGLPTNSVQEANNLELDKGKRMERIRAKTQQLQDLILQVVAIKENIKGDFPTLFFIIANRIQEPGRAEQGPREGGRRTPSSEFCDPVALHHREHVEEDGDRLQHLKRQNGVSIQL